MRLINFGTHVTFIRIWAGQKNSIAFVTSVFGVLRHESTSFFGGQQ